MLLFEASVPSGPFLTTLQVSEGSMLSVAVQFTVTTGTRRMLLFAGVLSVTMAFVTSIVKLNTDELPRYGPESVQVTLQLCGPSATERRVKLLYRPLETGVWLLILKLLSKKSVQFLMLLFS